MIPQRPHFNRSRLFTGLGTLLASLLLGCALLACAPDEMPLDPAPRSASDALEAGGAAMSVPDSRDSRFAEAPVRGLWVLAEGAVQVLDDVARIGPLLARAEQLGASDLFVQVYRGGRAFYRAGEFVERAESVNAQDEDALALLIAGAKRRGLRVHAWVNVLSLSTRADATLLRRLGRDGILVDRSGRSLLDYPEFDLPEPDRRFYRMGTRGLYLDPGVPLVRETLVATFRDLLARYPTLDGLHLDYIRHPGVLPFSPGSRFGVGLEFGYGETSRRIYREETGQPDPIEGAAPGVVRSANAWDEWRRQQVTTLVDQIAREARATRPGLVVSAAVIPYSDRAYLSLAQDWRRWLESGSIDLAIPMVYTLDDRLLGYQLESFAGWRDRDRIWPGLGTWLFSGNVERAVRQIERLRAFGFRGEVLFSDDAIAESPALLSALSERRRGRAGDARAGVTGSR